MHLIAAAWLMTSLTASAAMVALLRSANALPSVLLALPGGAVAARTGTGRPVRWPGDGDRGVPGPPQRRERFHLGDPAAAAGPPPRRGHTLGGVRGRRTAAAVRQAAEWLG